MRQHTHLNPAVGFVLCVLFLPVAVSAAGLSVYGNQIWHQEATYILGVAGNYDNFGQAVACGDFNGDGFGDLAIGVPNDDLYNWQEWNDYGAVNVVYGGPEGLDPTDNQIWRQGNDGLGGSLELGDRFGYALAGGDFNGDGYMDLAVGVPYEDVEQGEYDYIDCGVVYVIYGSEAGLEASGNQIWHQNSDGIVGVCEVSDQFGNALAAGKLNDDVYDDLVIGVQRENGLAGAVNVIYGSGSGLTSSGNQLWRQGYDGIADSHELYDKFGASVAIGHLNGDDYMDLAVGVPGEDSDSGAVHVIYGSAAGLTASGDQLWRQGYNDIKDDSEAGDEFGFAVAVGHLNGDDYMDLAVGVPGEDLIGTAMGEIRVDCGAVNVIFGSSAGLSDYADRFITQRSLYGILGDYEAGERFGCAVACGNFNGDGYGDLAVGARGEAVAGVNGAGAVAVLYGGNPQSDLGCGFERVQAWHQDVLLVEGECDADDHYGHALACGDFDGNGWSDLAVGIPGEDLEGIPDTGTVGVLYGYAPPFLRSSLFLDLIRGSAAWGDYDKDGDLDILLCGYIYSLGPGSRVYRNDSGSFTDIGAGLPGVQYGSVAWGDYDNDGDLDILLTGETDSGRIAAVYRNDGGSFSDVGAGLPGASTSAGAWGDYDNDGDLDILLTGVTDSGRIAAVYRNEGGSFTDSGAGLPGVEKSSVAWGDYDNDGDLDILLTGRTDSGRIAAVYRNDGVGFSDVGAGLPGVDEGAVAWGDFDGDGDLDFLLTGQVENGELARVYANYDGAFGDAGVDLLPVARSAVAWGDYDNDGDLDFLVIGVTFSLPSPPPDGDSVAWVCRNDYAPPNTPPAAPTSLGVLVDGSDLVFGWGAATDAETPAAGLSYNLRVGTTPGAADVVSAMADAGTGLRRIPALGNTNLVNSWRTPLADLPAAPLYWSVQAIDACFAGSDFASEEIFNGVSSTSGPEAPQKFALHPNVPNPFNPSTEIRYEVPAGGGLVALRIYDTAGRLVRTLRDGWEGPGVKAARWDGRNDSGRRMSSGVYFCTMTGPGAELTRKMVLLQ